MDKTTPMALPVVHSDPTSAFVGYARPAVADEVMAVATDEPFAPVVVAGSGVNAGAFLTLVALGRVSTGLAARKCRRERSLVLSVVPLRHDGAGCK
jgi:hypothetical protein